MALEDLQKQRQNILAEIRRRGGEAKAPNYAKQLKDIEGQIRTQRGAAPVAPGPAGMLAPPPTDKYEGLNQTQNNLINQAAQGDLTLGNVANSQLEQVAESYSKPIDWGQQVAAPDFNGMQRPDMPNWSQVQQGPVTGDFNNWRQQQIDSTYNDFSKRFEPQFKQQRDELEQSLRNRGIPVGSELYNQQMQTLDRNQSDARNSAMVQAQGIAGQNASQFANVGFQSADQSMNRALTQWDVGNQGFQNNWNDQLNRYNVGQQVRQDQVNWQQMQRGDALNSFNQLRAGQSPFGMTGYQYSNQRALQEDDQANQRWLMKNTPRGGGGGGGAGSNPLWSQYGFQGPMQYDAYRMDLDLEKARQLAQISRGNQPGQPNPLYAAGGIVLGNLGYGLLAA
jgi:hypothetical protein